MQRLRALAAIAAFLFISSVARAEDIKVEAWLIWGSNTDTNINCKVQDSRVTEALAKAFKWKNYYQITNRSVVIAADATQSLEMSAKCEIKVKNLNAGKVQVECFGDGKFVSRGDYSLTEGKWFTLAGPDKNDSAWFIVMRSRNPKGGEKD
jgi:hypothetical protein